MQNNIYSEIISNIQKGKKLFAVLIDPDKTSNSSLQQICQNSEIDFFLVGGSLLTKNNTFQTIEKLKKWANCPIILFPGNSYQIEENADALLFLSLISGRNPDALIGQHVAMAPIIQQMNLEVISTGYMLIDSGKPTTALYMSQTTPIPAEKPEIAMATALAGEMLGLKMIYMDGGSGAINPISPEMISTVKKNITVPLIIGGGINTLEKAQLAYNNGADIIVIGNKIEENPLFIQEIIHLKNSFSNA